jgi:hypothetical protein
MRYQLFDFLRASVISCADLSNFIDENWKVPPSRARELISLIEAREAEFKEGVLRIHSEFDSDCISAETFVLVMKKFHDEFVNDLRYCIASNTPLWMVLEVPYDTTHIADTIFEAARELDSVHAAKEMLEDAETFDNWQLN